MPEPTVVRMAREFKANLLLREQAQMQQMARSWLRVERSLEAQIAALSLEIAGDEMASVSKVLRLERTRVLLAQAKDEVRRYTTGAERTIADQQQQLGQIGIDNAAALIHASYPPFAAAHFDILPVDAIESMVGFAGDGTPLGKLLANAWPDAAQGIKDALIKAVALGTNPRETARRLNDGLSLGLNRILTITRTEQLRAYREATRMQYEQSGVVTSYKRIAAHDARTCAGCLLSEGKIYQTSQALDEHPQGRCSTVPVVKGMPALRWTGGATWLRQQDADTQRSIMGPGAYDAWKRGDIALGDLVKTTQSETWGGAVAQRPLSELVKA